MLIHSFVFTALRWNRLFRVRSRHPTPPLGRYGAVEDLECTLPCTGEPSRICGGANRTSIYRRAGQHGMMIGVGAYYAYDLIRLKLADRTLSSLQLPPGLVLTLYTRDRLEGTAVNITSDVPCLSSTPCAFDPSSTSWAEPAARCVNDVWNDQMASLSLAYASGPPPGYTPRPGAETGARAFARGTAGKLARLGDLGGDLGETNNDRPAGALSQYWRAPRNGDGEECIQRVGTYSSDQICLQSAQMMKPDHEATWVRPNPYRRFEALQQGALNAEFTDEFARLKRLEWRGLLQRYARPIFDRAFASDAGLVAGGGGAGLGSSTQAEIRTGSSGMYDAPMDGANLDGDGFVSWFEQWFGGIKHLVHLMGAGPGGEAPVLGLSPTGEVVPWAAAEMPPLPAHPFARAEERGDGISAPDPTGTRAAVVAHLREAEEVRARAGDFTPGATRTGPQHPEMVPYSTPRLEQRAALGGENAAYATALGSTYSAGFSGSDTPPQVGTAAYAQRTPTSPTLMQDRQQALIQANAGSKVEEEEAFFGSMV